MPDRPKRLLHSPGRIGLHLDIYPLEPLRGDDDFVVVGILVPTSFQLYRAILVRYDGKQNAANHNWSPGS